VTVNGVEIPYFFRYGGDDPVIPEEPEIPDDPVIPDEPATRYKMGNLRCRTIDFTKATNKGGDTWEPITWNGKDSFTGNNVWSDGTNIYYSVGVLTSASHYRLNGDTWEPITWNGEGIFSGDTVWTDGTNIYWLDYGSCVLDGDTWEPVEWSGSPPTRGGRVWSDGAREYGTGTLGSLLFSVRNGDVWERHDELIYLGIGSSAGFWSDGANIYYSSGSVQYVFDSATLMTTKKTWNGLTKFDGGNVWSDGVNIYYSDGEEQYVLNGDTWEPKVWNGLTSFFVSRLWTDGTNIYYSNGAEQYVLTSRKIVGYKYGDSDVLPDIESVWTDEVKETHPYAYVCEGMFRYVMFTSSPLYLSGRWLRPHSDCTWESYFIVDGSWETEKYGDAVAGDTMLSTSEFKWASIDVLNEDGSLYLATSEPIPVYE
jgi:hypothetical protein